MSGDVGARRARLAGAYARAAGAGTGQRGSLSRECEAPPGCRFRACGVTCRAAGEGASCAFGFPLTPAEWAGFPLAPSAAWGFDESGMPIVDQYSGNFNLAQGGAGTFAYQQTDDPDFPSELGIVANAASSYARTPLTTDFNVTTQANDEIAAFIVRCGGFTTDGSISRPIVAKRSRLAASAGYRLVCAPTTGDLRMHGSSTAVDVYSEIAGDHGDGGFFYVGGFVDRVTETIGCYSSRGGVFQASTPASIAGLGTFNNALRFSFGDANGVEQLAGATYLWAAAWYGARPTEAQFREMMGL